MLLARAAVSTLRAKRNAVNSSVVFCFASSAAIPNTCDGPTRPENGKQCQLTSNCATAKQRSKSHANAKGATRGKTTWKLLPDLSRGFAGFEALTAADSIFDSLAESVLVSTGIVSAARH